MKPIAGTSVFLKSTFVQFFARQRPASSVAKPRCIRKTSMPPISTQTLLIVKIASCAGVSTAAVSPAASAVPATARKGINIVFKLFMMKYPPKGIIELPYPIASLPVSPVRMRMH